MLQASPYKEEPQKDKSDFHKKYGFCKRTAEEYLKYDNKM